MIKCSFYFIIVFGFFLVGYINAQEQNENFKWQNSCLSLDERADALLLEMTLKEKMSQLLDVSVGLPRLDIPLYNWWNECLHGVARNGRSTVFPQAIGLAASFDTDLAFRVASAISDEARAKFNISVANDNRARYAGLTFWTPNINIFRDPRWGRGQETYGEDPFLTSRVGVAFVKGLQGDDPVYLKAAACAKHFAVHSGPEALRHEFDAVVSNMDLYDTYLPAFEALVKEANVESVMGAYNRVLGEPACGSKLLLQDILRDKWGFTGHVVSDCGALADFHLYHKVTSNVVESAALALNMGVDLNCGTTYKHLEEAFKQGLIDEETINARLKALLKTRIKLGLLDVNNENPYNKLGEETICSEKNRNLALEAAQKSIVLLSNKNNVLPLSPQIKNLYITGPQANNSDVLLGNYYGMSNRLVNILEGITAAVSSSTTINYKKGCLPYSTNINPIDWTTPEAKDADAIIAVLGISSDREGEEGDAIASEYKGDNIKPYLPANQVEFLRKLKHNNPKPVIAIITGGSPMILTKVNELADAIVWVWYPGQEGGTAVADVVFGNISPSGRLPLTFPASIEQLPPYEDYSMKGRTYRFMEDEPLFPFGFGLSYSKFEYTDGAVDKKVIKKGEPIKVTCTVTNVGDKDSEEVVQVYLVQPGAGLTAPFKKLVGFNRIKLNAKSSMSVECVVTDENIRQIDEKGNGIILKGDYKVVIGGSSPSKRLSEIGAPEPVELGFKVK